METNRLRQFRVVVETGNLRKAAEILGISHSGLSKSMKALEAELGFTLLRQSGRGIVVADEGRELFARSQRFLEELDRLQGRPEAPVGRSVRLGSFEVFTSFFIGPLLAKYLPGMAAEVHELGPGRLEEALALERVDIGITYEPIPRRGVEYVPAGSVSVGAYGRKGAFPADADLAGLPFVVPVSPLEGAPSGVKHRDAWPDERVHRRIQFRVDSLATGLELARQGLAVIFIPRFVARLHNEAVAPGFRLEALKLPRGLAAVKREIFLAKRDSTAEDQVFRAIARAIRDLCAG